jgi:hypothetical protein
MVAADLVVGAAVGRPQVDVLELIVLKTEADADEARPPPAPPQTSASSTSIAPLWKTASFTTA